MRYSEIVTRYYCIQLPPLGVALVDAHYLGAAHHRYRYLQSGDPLHAQQFRAHIAALHRAICRGDFSRARDPSGEGLDQAAAWAPPPAAAPDIAAILACLPDPQIFDGFPADRRYGPGVAFPYDAVLRDPSLVDAVTCVMLGTAA